MGASRLHQATDLGLVEGEVGRPFALHDGRSGDAGDLGVHLIGRLERRHDTARARVGEQNGLQNLVGAIGGEDVGDVHTVEVGDRLTERGRRTIGVAMPVDS